MKHKLLKSLLLLSALVVGSSSVWAVDQVYKSLTFPDDNYGNNGLTSSQYESTWEAIIGTAPNSFSWTISNFNNNNWQNSWTYIKCGRKKGKTANTPSVATITTSAAIDETVTKVIVTLTAINASDYNNIKLYMASNSAFNANLETFTVSPIPTTAGDMTITIPEAKRAANRFYKLEFDTKGGTSSNGHTGISKVDYYYDYVSAATLDHIVLGGTYPTEFYVGDTFTHDGLTVTAHYDDASTVDVTASATFSSPDMSTPGTKTITVSYEDNSVEKTATYNITVSPAPSVVLTLNFGTNIFGLPVGSGNKVTTSTGYSYGGYTYTLAAPDGFYYGDFTDYNCLFMGKSGATLTFPAYPFNVKMIKVYGTSGASTSVKQNIFVGDDPICTETTGAKNVTNVYNIPSAYQAGGTVYVLKVTSSANTQISKIEILGNEAAPAYVGASKYSTFATTCGLDFANATPAGLEAYVVSAVSASSVTLTAVNEAPASTGVILKGAASTVYTIPVKAAAAEVGTNHLYVSTGSTTGDGSTIYALGVGKAVPYVGQVGFYKVKNDETVPAGKAYLNIAVSVKEFLPFDFDEDDADGIVSPLGETEEGAGAIYNLAGQRLQKMQKGINIVNGKKILK